MYLCPGLCHEPRWGSLQRSPDPLAGGEGACCPSQEPLSCSRPSASNFGSLSLRNPTPKKDMGSVNNQNCCKWFCFTEKVEKHWPTVNWKRFVVCLSWSLSLFSQLLGYNSNSFVVVETCFRVGIIFRGGSYLCTRWNDIGSVVFHFSKFALQPLLTKAVKWCINRALSWEIYSNLSWNFEKILKISYEHTVQTSIFKALIICRRFCVLQKFLIVNF